MLAWWHASQYMQSVTKREPFFECVFVSDRNEYRFHFRAWTAAEAEYHLRRELQESGVAADGELRVLDKKGHLLSTSAYRPVLDARPPSIPR